MRTPHPPPPSSERTVVPDIMRGEGDVRPPQESFGGVSPKLESEERTTGNLEEQVAKNTDNFVATARKNQILDQAKTFLGTAKSTEGLNSIPYSPTKDDSRSEERRVGKE